MYLIIDVTLEKTDSIYIKHKLHSFYYSDIKIKGFYNISNYDNNKGASDAHYSFNTIKIDGKSGMSYQVDLNKYPNDNDEINSLLMQVRKIKINKIIEKCI